ncbi:hypothetical protein F511_45733 [Dorcoceras hygrometricum]|uniref:Uncharacterized protein n=1 Tax=Dorcoceras hygrometricum TaxID=472368 RepID=A0A2Z6ZVB0_9LAMI|nr:hypothetical protein F511_45733 [Dorcoceras hygrometricum]
MIDDLPPPTVKSQSPCDSGWSQAPVASKVTPRETPYEWFIVLYSIVLNVSRSYFKTSVALPGYGIRIRHRYSKSGGGRYRQSGPRPETGFLRQPALEGLTRSARTDSPRQVGRNNFRRREAAAAAHGGGGVL